jgi:hypothetical protein
MEAEPTKEEPRKRKTFTDSTRVLFVDNDPKNWLDDMSVLRETVDNFESSAFDDDIPNSSIIRSQSSSKNEWDEYMRLFPGNSYVEFIKTFDKKDISALTKYKPTNGVNPDEIISVCLSKGYKLVIFDFDRTVTCVEGVAIKDIVKEKDGKFGKYQVSQGSDLLDRLNRELVTYEDLMQVLMGGQERLDSVRRMFQFLKENNIGFIIITNNPNANVRTPNRNIFLNILNALTSLPLEVCNSILFCTKDHMKKDGGKFLYKKYLAACLEGTPFYPIIESACSSIKESLSKSTVKESKKKSNDKPVTTRESVGKKSKTKRKSKTPPPSHSPPRGGRSKKNKTRRNNK